MVRLILGTMVKLQLALGIPADRQIHSLVDYNSLALACTFSP